MTTLDAEGPNAGQITYWNEQAGPNWVAMQDELDRELVELGEAAMAALAPRAGERLYDIGCGCSATTMELARRVGAAGRVTAVDITAPMLAVARERAAAAGLAQARFVQADAQTYAFEPADGVFSRFGVMFFADPVAAFANIRRGLKPGGRLAFVCWRPFAENPWMSVPMAAVLPLLAEPPPTPPPGAPGPFAFADGARLRGIIEGAGFADVSIAPHTAKVAWGDVDTAVRMALRLGPVAAVARDNPQLREAMFEAMRTALEPHATSDGVSFDSATWIVL